MNEEQRAALEELLEAVAAIEATGGRIGTFDRSEIRSRYMRAVGRVERAFF
jgi:plasmid stabilization system protein ParE